MSPSELKAREGGDSNFAIFACLLAVAALVHQVSKLTAMSSVPATLVSVSALLLLLRPRQTGALLLFATAQLAMLLWHAPPNRDSHWVLLGLVNLAVLVGAVSAAREGARLPRPDRLQVYVFPLVRGCVLLLYALSILHKLNSGFLDPQLSCAVTLYRVLGRRVPLPDAAWLETVAIYGALASEALIPMLLCTRRFRAAGILCGLLFHFVMGLADFYNFSWTLLPLYVAFLPGPFGRELARLWSRVSRRVSVYSTAGLLGAWLLLFVAIIAILGLKARSLDAPRVVHAGFYALWIIGGACMTAGYVAVTAFGTGWGAAATRSIAPRRAWHVAVYGLTLLNGLAPYLGLKTEASFAMYSNLRTEGPYWNHLLLPPALKLARYQDDLIGIHASSEAVLRLHHERAEQLVAVEFERLLGRLCADGRRPVAVEYTRAGERRSVTDACAAPERARSSPLWEPLLVFRPVTAICVH